MGVDCLMVEAYLSNTALVRRLARNVVPLDFTDPQIITEQKAAYSDIFIATQINWADTTNVTQPSINPTYSTDARIASVRKRETQRAAQYILEHYGSGSAEELNWISYWNDQFEKGMASIKEGGVDVESDIGTYIAVSDYGSYPGSLLDNPYAMPYRSTYEHL